MNKVIYIGLLVFILSAVHAQETVAFQNQPLFVYLLTYNVDNKNTINDLQKQYNSTLPITVSHMWNWDKGEMSFATPQMKNLFKQTALADKFSFYSKKSFEKSTNLKSWQVLENPIDEKKLNELHQETSPFLASWVPGSKNLC